MKCFTSAHTHVCVCLPRNTLSCPGSHILLDLALCSGSDRDFSVRSIQQLPRTDMQHSVTQHQSQSTWPHICLTVLAYQPREAGDALAVLLAAWSLFHLGLLELSYSAPGQSAWSNTKPSASKLTLEDTNSKAWGRYKITLQSPARKGLWLAWKPLVSSSSRGRPVSYIAADDPNFWSTVIPRKSSPAVLLKK